MKRILIALALALLAQGAQAEEKSVIKKAGEGVEKGAEATGRGLKKGGEATVKGVKKAGEWVGKKLQKGGEAIEKAAKDKQ